MAPEDGRGDCRGTLPGLAKARVCSCPGAPANGQEDGFSVRRSLAEAWQKPPVAKPATAVIHGLEDGE